MKKVFDILDKYEDLVVPRKALIVNIEKDPQLSKLLFRPAICMKEVGRYISLGRVLNQILIEEEVAPHEYRGGKEYISLQQFLRYFTKYEIPSKKVLKKEASRLEDEM